MKPLTNEEMKKNPNLFYEQMGITGKMKKTMEKLNQEFDSDEGMSLSKSKKLIKKG